LTAERRNRSLIVAGTLALVGMIWIMHAYLREAVYQFEFTRRVEYAKNLAHSFEEHTRALLDEVMTVLKTARHEFERHGDLPAVEAFLKKIPIKAKIVDHIAIDDRDGDVVLLNGYPSFPRSNVADRDYFVFQKNNLGDEPFIGTPVVGRASGKMLFRISLPLRDPGGAFAGIVKAGVDPQGFSQFYDSVILGPNGVAALIGLDTIIRARSSGSAQAVGQSIAGSALWPALEQSPHGAFPQISIVDGEPRTYAYRKVRGYPLVVAIGVAERDARAAAAYLRDLTTLLASVATLIVFAVAVLLWRQMMTARALTWANQAKSQFLARMSHELRTPLNAVLGFAEIIRDQTFGRDATAKYAEYAGDIHVSGAYLLELINDVLDLSKIEAGRYDLAEEEVDVLGIAAECLAMMTEAARRGGVTIHNRLGADIPRLRADRRALRQILLNLLSNAVKFTPSGGEVTVLGYIDNNGDLAIIVRDTGVGIRADFLAQITEPFARDTAMVRDKVEGSGLGLAISDRLMKLHGGALSIETLVGRGTAVNLRFPAKRVIAAAAR
jgi:signal transduction histidine kinase